MLRDLTEALDLNPRKISFHASFMNATIPTDLVHNPDQPLPIRLAFPYLVLHPPTPRPLRIPCIQHLNHDIAPINHLFQLARESADRGIPDGERRIERIGGDEVVGGFEG